jgi:hypothetical protein
MLLRISRGQPGADDHTHLLSLEVPRMHHGQMFHTIVGTRSPQKQSSGCSALISRQGTPRLTPRSSELYSSHPLTTLALEWDRLTCALLSMGAVPGPRLIPSGLVRHPTWRRRRRRRRRPRVLPFVLSFSRSALPLPRLLCCCLGSSSSLSSNQRPGDWRERARFPRGSRVGSSSMPYNAALPDQVNTTRLIHFTCPPVHLPTCLLVHPFTRPPRLHRKSVSTAKSYSV